MKINFKNRNELNLEIYNSKDNDYEIKIQNEEQGYKLFDVLAKNNIKVLKFEIKKPSLNDIFIEKVEEEKIKWKIYLQ